MCSRAKRRADRRNQNRKQSQHRNYSAPRPTHSNWIVPVHPYSLTLPRRSCFVKKALLLSSPAALFSRIILHVGILSNKLTPVTKGMPEHSLIRGILVGLGRFELPTNGL
jgi:hypothetical protein